MLIVILLINIVLLIRPAISQVDPGWIRDLNIDAGETKAVNFDRCRTSASPQVRNPSFANSTFIYTQTYNKTDFILIPKVALAQLSYDFFYEANPQMGYRITLNESSITNRSFKYTVQIVGVRVCGLHFMYLAVQRVYDPFYMIQVYPLTFNTSDPVMDTTAGATRVQTVRLNYPNNQILPANFSPSNYAFQTWLLSYIFTSTTHLAINLTCSTHSTTQFQLNITVSNNFILKQLNITAALIDRVKIFEYSYSIYIDQIYNHQRGNFQLNMTNLTTITDISTQYFYRNTLSGLTANFISFHSNLTYFYSFQSSSSVSLFTGYGLNLRTRSCISTSSYYFYETMECIVSCPVYYYSNVTYKYCIKCHYSCQNCSAPALANACTTCQAAKFRQFDTTNTSCVCLPAYYQLTSNCLPCDRGCLNCTGASLCSLCNISAHFTLQSGNCQCSPQYSQNNSVCILTTSLCGNGVMQLDEKCDDNNLQDGDGCSSLCIIQPNYTCLNDNFLYPYSLCYYSGNIALNLTYVYKVPLENAVQIIMTVSADNINQTALKLYLQTQTALSFKEKTRLLSPSAITQQTYSYDIATSKLTISFKYDSDIDLSSLSLQFKPSLSNGTNVRYFYDTPTAGLTLVLPYNKLLTTFLEQTDRSKQESISWVFLVLIILSWVYLLVAIAYKQSAMALEFFMVLQVTYESLLQSGFIYDGWIGLIFFGKYTYGVNIANIVQTQLDRLSIIGLNSALINTLNITVALCFLSILIILIIFVYQMRQRSKQRESVQVKATNDKIQLGRQTAVELNHSSYQLKKSIFLVCLQAGIVLVFITFRIIVISVCLAIKESTFMASSLLPLLAISACAIVLFIFYYKFFDYEGMTQLSYRRILSNLQIQQNKQNQSNICLLLSNFLLKYHYLLIFILMSIFAIVDAVSSLGTGLYLSVAVGAVAWWLVIAFNGNYLRKLHTVRAAINTICLIVTMITLLLQTLNILNPSQNITAPLLGLSLLFISLIFNTTVLIRIEYKRRRKRRYQTKATKANKVKNVVILKQRNQTEQAVQINKNPDKNEGEIDRSLIHLADNPIQKQKSERFSVSNESSRQPTAKKFQLEDRFNARTQHKKYTQPTDKIEQTAHKWNIQQVEQNRQEHNQQANETALKPNIKKHLDFQDI